MFRKNELELCSVEHIPIWGHIWMLEYVQLKRVSAHSYETYTLIVQMIRSNQNGTLDSYFTQPFYKVKTKRYVKGT